MKKLISLCLLLMLFSCNNSEVFSKVMEDFPENQWADAVTFNFETEGDVADARLVLKFRHIHEPQYDVVPVEVTITYPDGKAESIETDLFLKTDDGKYISDCLGDICDLEQELGKNVVLAKGSYTITIAHKAPVEYIPNVLAVGFAIEQSDKQ